MGSATAQTGANGPIVAQKVNDAVAPNSRGGPPVGLSQRSPEARVGRLLQKPNLEYQGAFVLFSTDEPSHLSAGEGLGYNPANNSLFTSGRGEFHQIAEVKIPASLGKDADPDSLPVAQVLQPLVDVAPKISNWNAALANADAQLVGGLLPWQDKLVVAAYGNYDAAGGINRSHAVISSWGNIGRATGTALAAIKGAPQAGFVAGCMTVIPDEHAFALGGKYACGLNAANIAGRTSQGPCLFTFDPSQIGSGSVTFRPLVYYTLDNPLADGQQQSTVWNRSARVHGMAVVKGTKSALFFGSMGHGPLWYGEANQGPTSKLDTVRVYKGYHAPPYFWKVWAYNIDDLAGVKAGKRQPWKLSPYAIWEFELPYESGEHQLAGVAYDESGRLIYVCQWRGTRFGRSVVHVFKIK